MKKIYIGLILIAALIIGATTAAILPSVIELPTTGVTATAELELYETDGVTPQTNLDWGTVSDGVTTQYSILKNVGTTDLTLTMTTTDETYTWLDQTWDQEGTVLIAGDQVTVTWTLTLTGVPATSFSYTTTITGTEAP